MTNGNNITVTGSLNFSGGVQCMDRFRNHCAKQQLHIHAFRWTNDSNYCSFRDTTAVTNAITATNSIDYGHNTNVTPITPPSGGGSCPGRIIGGENNSNSDPISRSTRWFAEAEMTGSR